MSSYLAVAQSAESGKPKKTADQGALAFQATSRRDAEGCDGRDVMRDHQ
jgi:hypothetical protein